MGIISLLKPHDHLEILPPLSPPTDIKPIIQQSSIDVLVIELSLLKTSGLMLIRELINLDPALRVLVMSRKEKEPFISKCIEYGALGYISLQCSVDELITAINTVYQGNNYLSQDVAYSFALSKLNNNQDCVLQLTDREYQVFTALAQGMCVKDIAMNMCLSPKTVHVYRSNIMKKLNVTNTAELTIIAFKNGIITIDLVD
jgi:DNA-binding NarL/FixJ family response regulator